MLIKGKAQAVVAARVVLALVLLAAAACVHLTPPCPGNPGPAVSAELHSSVNLFGQPVVEGAYMEKSS